MTATPLAPAQLRTGSLMEALANVAADYIVAIFTAASLTRSYVLRRFFEHLAAHADQQNGLQRSERLRQHFARRP